MRTGFGLAAVLLTLALLSPGSAADKPVVVDLWPGPAPLEKGEIAPEKETEGKAVGAPIRILHNVTRPTLSIFRPAKDKDTGAAVVIAPGGGYNILAWDLEGEEVATWLNTLGVTGIVLKYRVPRRQGTPGDKAPPQAQADAQRAISLTRSKAKEWGIDPTKIGMLGFSAGGHLTAWTATNSDKRSYEAVDDADKQSCRPDFVVLVYPAYLIQKGKPDVLAEDIRPSKETPPTFFAHAYNDGISPENSIALFLALKRLGVPAELHVYSTGGHGFGLRPSPSASSTWPARCEDWLRAQGVLPGKK
jgi:acetyl esterase/lipase